MDREKALAQLDKEFRPLAGDFLRALDAAGINYMVTSARRTIKEQDKLFAQGRTISGKIVTRAKGGQSPHNFGCAIDVCPTVNGKPFWDAPPDVWDEIGNIGKEAGLQWGGDFRSFKDKPHFELPDWRVIQAAWQRGLIKVD